MICNNDIVRRLRELREHKKLSRLNLAYDSELATGLIARYEMYQTEPRLYNVMRLADSLGVTLKQLTGLPDGKCLQNETLGERLLLALRRRNMTGRELAKRIGVKPNTISRYINDSRLDLNFLNIARIAEVLNVDLDWLCGRG